MIEIDIRLARAGGFALECGFAVPGSGVTALFGRSGAGKTTVIQAVAGVVRPDAGRIAVKGEVFFDSRARHRCADRGAAHRLCIPGCTAFFPHLSVESNLRYGERRSRAVERPVRFEAVVELLGIGPLLTRRPHTLSGGERQRVAIGRALLAQPRLLLMDEPLAALDEARKAEILPYLERLRDETRLPILYVSHSIDEVLRLADTLVALREGRQVAAGPVAQVMSQPAMLPVLGRFDLGTLLECVVSRHDPAYALSSLAFAGGELRVPQVARAVGEKVRARVRARDVAIARTRPEDVSVSNLLPAVVEEVRLRKAPMPTSCCVSARRASPRW
ncbi:molybdenum ABC transporter ATP-binding protein [Ancylobacter dichloromethanicus]